jgi:hypothetical protein
MFHGVCSTAESGSLTTARWARSPVKPHICEPCLHVPALPVGVEGQEVFSGALHAAARRQGAQIICPAGPLAAGPFCNMFASPANGGALALSCLWFSWQSTA